MVDGIKDPFIKFLFFIATGGMMWGGVDQIAQAAVKIFETLNLNLDKAAAEQNTLTFILVYIIIGCGILALKAILSNKKNTN